MGNLRVEAEAVTGRGNRRKEREKSNESEKDLGVMVSEFIEDGSGSGHSWCGSSDPDSTFGDLHLLADNLKFFKHSSDLYESDLQSVVQSLLLSMGDKHLQLIKSDLCDGSCIRYALVKLLKSSGYDAAVCSSKWQGCNKVPGGEYEYIDVVNYNITSERLIIDIDFRSHFTIARAVESYDKILKSLPVVFVGSLTKLEQFLQVMADASRVSLKQNAMPLPPWRSLAYLQAKWLSPFQRNVTAKEKKIGRSMVISHKQCSDHLRRLQSSIQLLLVKERLLKPLNLDSARRVKKLERRNSAFR